MSTIKVSNLQNASAASPAFVLASDGSATANLSSVNDGPIAGTRNRIINGDMRIDQRNAGAAVTINDSAAYTLDRWYSDDVSDGSWTIQRSTTAPAGFTNSLLVTITAADTSLSSAQRCRLLQIIEGFNSSDFAWGTASAKTVSLSFWVRCSVTGTFSGALINSAENRSYPFTYSISAANTFEYKTITIAGDTSGTWLSDNGAGIRLVFSLGVGSSFLGTAGAWAGSVLLGATGETPLIATNGATFYITGVQLEPGTVATPFERRSYGQELALCERYYQKLLAGVTVPSTTITGNYAFATPFRVVPRTSGTSLVSYANTSYANASSLTCIAAGNYGVESQWTSSVNGFAGVHYTDIIINAEF